MDKKEFQNYCHDYFIRKGFMKHKSAYYKWNENGIVCCLWLQSSGGGTAYYINCDIYIDFYDCPRVFPDKQDYDLSGRKFTVLSKDTYNGKHFMDAQIDYKYYSIEELESYFDRAYNEVIAPSIENKRSLAANLSKWKLPFYLRKDPNEVLKKLQDYL